jgi:hypothetical protein
MTIIDSDDPTLSKLLRDHVNSLEATGGWVNPALIIRSTESEISLAHAGETTPETRLVWVPSTALISIGQGILSHHGDDIIPGDEASKRQPRELRILEVKCDIFNVTGKLAKARKRLPRFALANAPELLESLVSRRVHLKSGRIHARTPCRRITAMIYWPISSRPDVRNLEDLSLSP